MTYTQTIRYRLGGVNHRHTFYTESRTQLRAKISELTGATIIRNAKYIPCPVGEIAVYATIVKRKRTTIFIGGNIEFTKDPAKAKKPTRREKAKLPGKCYEASYDGQTMQTTANTSHMLFRDIRQEFGLQGCKFLLLVNMGTAKKYQVYGRPGRPLIIETIAQPKVPE